MNKLAITGVLFIGLALLLTHVGVVMSIQVRIARRDPDAQRFTTAVVADAEKLMEGISNEMQALSQEPNVYVQINQMLEIVRKEFASSPLTLDSPVVQTGSSNGSYSDIRRVADFSVIIDGPPIELPTWLLLYQFGGAVLIIFGTAFLAIGIRKRAA